MTNKLEQDSNKKTIKFSMKIVVSSIIFIMLYTVAQMILSYKVGMELAPTLTTCVYTFFGTELTVCGVIKVFDTIKEKKKRDKEEEYIPEEV